MITLQAEELLIPRAGGFNVAYRDHGLGLGGVDGHHDANPVAGRILDLGQPALTPIELRTSAHCAAVGLDLGERTMETVRSDPHHGSTKAGRRCISRQLADHSRGFEASAVAVNRPSEDACVERSGSLDVQRWKLQVVDLPVRRVIVALTHGDFPSIGGD